MLLQKPADIYSLSFLFIFIIKCVCQESHITTEKTKLQEPWTVAVPLSVMNKPCSSILMKDSASTTRRYTGSGALSVEPVSQHWLPVVILSRDWSWQSSASQTRNPVYLSRQAAVAHHSPPALPVSSLGRQSLRQHEDRKTGGIAEPAALSTLLTPKSSVSGGSGKTAGAQTQTQTRCSFERSFGVNSDFHQHLEVVRNAKTIFWKSFSRPVVFLGPYSHTPFTMNEHDCSLRSQFVNVPARTTLPSSPWKVFALAICGKEFSRRPQL